MTTQIDQDWPEQGLEQVSACPYCGSCERTLAYRDVQDWSFHCAPGKWSYWDCVNCLSLYLDPRPTQATIGLAYATYYTHGTGKNASLFQGFKSRLRNECLSQKLNASIEPRLHLPRWLGGPVALIGKQVTVPFGWDLLADLPKGRFLDVGCGAGLSVAWAKKLGWDAMGVEVDLAAVREARRTGLNIVEGTYEQLTRYQHQFDCVLCSHVLEHVHYPRDLLAKLNLALRPGGVLMLTLPNAGSSMRHYFGANWRGLEAPRHLAIPHESRLFQLLSEAGFSIKSIAGTRTETAVESYRIQQRRPVLSRRGLAKARKLGNSLQSSAMSNDFINFVCELQVVGSRRSDPQ